MADKSAAASFLDKQINILGNVKDMYMDKYMNGFITMTLSAIPNALIDMLPLRKYLGGGFMSKVITFFIEGQKQFNSTLFATAVINSK